MLRENCPRIAIYLGNALCAPVLELVPEGGIEPQTGHMTSPGTISLRQETFEAVMTSTEKLSFGNLRWGNNEANHVALALPFCKRLRELSE